MALKSILSKQTDFTGEFPAEYAKDGLWRFNEENPDEDTCLSDSSGKGRKAFINNWSAPTAVLKKSEYGNCFRMNTNDPPTEQTYLKITNDGSIFSNLGERIICGGWICPTIYSIGSQFCPIFNTRYGPGNPIFYLSFWDGDLRLMLYDESGELILDEWVRAPFQFNSWQWYFVAAIIESDNKKACYVVGDKSSGTVWKSEDLTFTGELNRSCTADIIFGMHADSYWYAGAFDDWFLDCDSKLTAKDLMNFFRSSIMANGGNSNTNSRSSYRQDPISSGDTFDDISS